MRVCDYIAKFIYEKGTEDVFMLSGGGIMHLTDGLACHKELKIYCLHHEQSVSMAMEAYSRLIGKMGVGYFTTGPGATNAITGLAGAWLDSVPCLFISGQVKRREAIYTMGIPGIRQVGVQEINILPIVESITKYAVFVDKPEDIRFHLEKAYYLAREGRPGPVWLDIPLDVQGALVDPDSLRGFQEPDGVQKENAFSVKEALDYLLSAKRPVILAGQGVRISGAIGPLLKLVEDYHIPVVTSFLGIDVIDSQHPCYAGRIGIKGDRAGNLTIQNSDCVLALGTSLPVAETGYEYDHFAREAKVIVVDIDMSSHQKKMIKIDLKIQADITVFLKKLACSSEDCLKAFDRTWLSRCISWRQKYPVCLDEYTNAKDQVNIYFFIESLSTKLDKKDVVVTDTGSAFYAGSQGIKIKQGLRYVTSGGLVTMGYSLPAAFGLSVALGKKRVMCITGDGSFQQNIQELQSVMHYDLPVKIFVLNNQGYLSIRSSQNKYFQGRLIGEGETSGISFPDHKKIAKAYGMKFFRVKKNAELDKILDEVLQYDGPVFCEIMTPPEQLIVPTVSSEKRSDGSMCSKPLEDMFPFLERKEFLDNMIVAPLPE
ncbi:MAG: thiamine pyrophosphate-binding protein [Candidatus Omnitrophota bacterium]